MAVHRAADLDPALTATPLRAYHAGSTLSGILGAAAALWTADTQDRLSASQDAALGPRTHGMAIPT